MHMCAVTNVNCILIQAQSVRQMSGYNPLLCVNGKSISFWSRQERSSKQNMRKNSKIKGMFSIGGAELVGSPNQILLRAPLKLGLALTNNVSLWQSATQTTTSQKSWKYSINQSICTRTNQKYLNINTFNVTETKIYYIIMNTLGTVSQKHDAWK